MRTLPRPRRPGLRQQRPRCRQEAGEGSFAHLHTCHGHALDVVPRAHPGSKVARMNMDATCGKCHDQDFLKKLSTRLPKRASRMDLQKMPGK